MSPQPINVLLIEDNREDARIIQQALAKNGRVQFQLTQVDRLSLALPHLSRGGIDLVLLDLMLPDSRGIEAVITVHRQAGRVPIVVLTASDDEALALEALQQGAQDYLVKAHVQIYPKVLERSIWYALERKRVEEELRSAHTQNEQLLSSIPSILIGVSPDGGITHWNDVAESVFGIAKAQILHRRLAESGIRWDTARILASMTECQRRGRPASLEEVVVTHPDGTERWVGITVVPIRGEAEGPAGFLLFGADITERKRSEAERTRLETQLGEAQRLETVGRFAWGIAHDFQNFLQVILGFAWLMRTRYQESPELLNDLNEIVHAAESASGMIRQLLAFSRRQALKPTLLEIGQTLRNMDRVLQQFVGDRIRVELPLVSEPLLVKLDPTALEQLLINLASNAKDAMRETGGTLTIRTARVLVDDAFVASHSWARAGDYVRVSVQDTGEGIDPNVVAHIFEPFFTTKKQGKGAGLGLAVVYGLVKQHEGFIDIETALTVGTTFHLYFPTQDLLHAMQAVSPRAVPRRAERAEAVLVIGHEERERAFTEEVLRESGYRIIASGDETRLVELVQLHANQVDLVVVDISWVGANGAEVVGRVRAVRPRVDLLLISGYVDERLRSLERSLSRVRVLQKPYMPAQLLTVVGELVGCEPIPPPATRSTAPPAAPARPRVLVVDDDASICRLCERMLQDTCQVSTVSSGRGALEALGRESYDVLLTDLIMPEMDGFTLIEEAMKRRPSLRVAVMSGSLTNQMQERLRAATVYCEVLHKPFTATTLHALITRSQN